MRFASVGRGTWTLAGFLLLAVAAVPEARGDFVVGEVFPPRQPDGTIISVRVWGDEFHRVVESLDGFTLVLDPVTRAACCARLSADGTRLISTGVNVDSATGASVGLTKHLRISAASAKTEAAARRLPLVNETAVAGTIAGAGPPNIGNIRGIVLLVDFAVDEPRSIPTDRTTRLRAPAKGACWTSPSSVLFPPDTPPDGQAFRRATRIPRWTGTPWADSDGTRQPDRVRW